MATLNPRTALTIPPSITFSTSGLDLSVFDKANTGEPPAVFTGFENGVITSPTRFELWGDAVFDKLTEADFAKILKDNGDSVQNRGSNADTTQASEPPPRELNEYPISYNRKYFGGNLDVAETLEKIQFNESYMRMNIAYLTFWKRGNIVNKATIDAPNATNPTTGDKTKEDCKQIWGVDWVNIANQPLCPEPKDWEFSTIKFPNIEDTPIEPYVPGDLSQYDFANSGFLPPNNWFGSVDSQIDSTNTTNIFAPTSAQKTLETIYSTLYLRQSEFFKKKNNFWAEKIKVLTNQFNANLPNNLRMVELDRSYDGLIEDLIDTPIATRVEAFEYIQQAYKLTREALVAEDTEVDTNSRIIYDEFFETDRLTYETNLRALRTKIKTDFRNNINLFANEAIIDEITSLDALDQAQLNEKIAEIRSNYIFDIETAEEINAIKTALELIYIEILDLQSQYETEKRLRESSNNIEVIPNPEDYDQRQDTIYNADVSSSLPDILRETTVYGGKFNKDASLTAVEGVWQFLYNPEDLKYNFGPNYIEAPTWANAEGTPVHWAGNASEELSFSKIVLNGYTFGRKVEKLIDGIKALTNVKQPGSQQSPPVLEFVWGKKYFGPCVMKDISITETMWDGGEAVSAELSFTLRMVPDWIVNDGYVSIFDPTGLPVVNIPDRVSAQVTEETVAAPDENTNNNTNGSGEAGKATPAVANDCPSTLDIFNKIKINGWRKIANNIESVKYTVPGSSTGYSMIQLRRKYKQQNDFLAKTYNNEIFVKINNNRKNSIVRNVADSSIMNSIAIKIREEIYSNDGFINAVAERNKELLSLFRQLDTVIQNSAKSCKTIKTASFSKEIDQLLIKKYGAAGPLPQSQGSKKCDRVRNSLSTIKNLPSGFGKTDNATKVNFLTYINALRTQVIEIKGLVPSNSDTARNNIPEWLEGRRNVMRFAKPYPCGLVAENAENNFSGPYGSMFNDEKASWQVKVRREDMYTTCRNQAIQMIEQYINKACKN